MYVLRANWTQELKNGVFSFLAEEKKYPPVPLEDFPDNWKKDGKKLFWKDMEVIATEDERKKLLKNVFYVLFMV